MRGHIVLDGDPAFPPPKGHSPQFSAHICYGEMAGWIKMSLRMEVGLRARRLCVRWGPSPPPPQKGDSPHNFRPTSIVAERLDRSRWYLIGMEVGLGPGHIVLDRDPAPLPQKGDRAPNFRPMSIVAKRLYVSGYHCTQVGLSLPPC